MAKDDVRGDGLPAIISEKVRGLITRGALAAGVHLGQTELAERFNVSRVPVREALKLLKAEGLVDHDMNRGFFVARLSSAEAHQLYRMRQVVETELLNALPWPSEEELAELRAMLDEMEALLTRGERAEWARVHRAFHRRIFDFSDQKILVREVVRLWALTDRYRSLLPPPQHMGPDEGEALLVRALARKDREALIRAFQDDRARIEAMLLAILADRNL